MSGRCIFHRKPFFSLKFTRNHISANYGAAHFSQFIRNHISTNYGAQNIPPLLFLEETFEYNLLRQKQQFVVVNVPENIQSQVYI